MKRIDKIASDIFPDDCICCVDCVTTGIRKGIELAINRLESRDLEYSADQIDELRRELEGEEK
jgi:hypothetical protein